MSGPRVIVVGSLHYDIMVDAVGWPALGETIPARRWRPKLGGKGRNQAVSTKAAGIDTLMVGAVGRDEFGRELASDLVGRGIDTRYLRTIEAQGSGISVALSDGAGDYRAFIISSANLGLEPTDLPPPDEWRKAAVLVLQNEIPESINLAAAQAARAAGAMVVLNAAPYRPLAPELLGALDLLVINAVEAAQLGGFAEPTSIAAAGDAARQLVGRARAVVVTAGASGSAYAAADRSFAVPAERVDVRSAHGAGDAFVGALAAGLARIEPIEAAMRAASQAAALLISAPEA